MVSATSSSLAYKSISGQAENQLAQFCINEMRRWADEARLEAFSNIKRLEPDARGHQRTIGRSGALILNSLVDGYGKSWVRDDWGPQWMWRTYWDWLELGIKRTSARIQRRNLGEDGDGLILEKDGIRPTDGQVVNFFCLADPVGLFLKATDERLALIDASGRSDRFTKRVRESLLEQKAQVLRWLGREDERQQEAHDNRTACDTDPPAQELLYLSDRDPLHNYNKERRSLKGPLKKDSHLSLDRPDEPKKPRSIEKVTAEDARWYWETLCDLDPFGDQLRRLAQIMADKNKCGKVAPTKVWKKLGERYLKHREERPYLSGDAWSMGFEEAIFHDAPNIGYVVKVAERYHELVPSDWYLVAVEFPPSHDSGEPRQERPSIRRAELTVGDNGDGHASGIGTITSRRETVNRFRSRYDNGDTVQLEGTVELDPEEAGNRARQEELRTLTKGLFKKIEADDD